MRNSLRRSPLIKSYEIQGKKIAAIVFFRNGEIILEVNRGYLEATRKTAPTLPAEDVQWIDALDPESVKLRRKLDLNRAEHFIIKENKKTAFLEDGYTLYLCAAVGFQFVGAPFEFKAMETATHVYYHTGIDVTACWNGETEPRTITITRDRYSRTEITARGEQCERLAELLSKGPRIDVAPWQCEYLVKHADEIIDILTGGKPRD